MTHENKQVGRVEEASSHHNPPTKGLESAFEVNETVSLGLQTPSKKVLIPQENNQNYRNSEGRRGSSRVFKNQL